MHDIPLQGEIMSRAIRLHSIGGPEVLSLEPVQVARPGRGQVRIKQTAVGLNFIDVYVRTGLYPATLPSGLGMEAAGVVTQTGPGVRTSTATLSMRCGGVTATRKVVSASFSGFFLR